MLGQSFLHGVLLHFRHLIFFGSAPKMGKHNRGLKDLAETPVESVAVDHVVES